MGKPETYKVGEAPWETGKAQIYKVGEAPWETGAQPQESSWLDTKLPLGTSPRGIIQGGLDALPVAGMIGGGIVGSPADVVTGPMGTAVGAGIGSAAGTAIKKAGERFLLGKQESNSDVLKNTALAVPEGMAGEMGGQVLGKGLSAAAGTKLGQAAIAKAGSGAAKVGELFTGVPTQEIKTYAAHGPEIDATSAANDHNAQDIADSIRSKINETIGGHRKELNGQISKALESGRGAKDIDITPVIDALHAQKAKLDPSLHPEDIADIDNLIKRITGTADKPANEVSGYVTAGEKNARVKGVPYDQRITELTDGEIPNKLKHKMEPVPVIENASSTDPKFPEWTTEATKNDKGEVGVRWVNSIPQDTVIKLPISDGAAPKYATNAAGLHQIQQFLQDKAASAYGGSPVGFQVGSQAAKAAKGAASVGRGILNEASPEIGAANARLARLHEIEDVMNKSMLAEGKTASPLFAAGSGNNPANAKILRQLGDETGTDVLGEAQKLAAARTFGKPQLMPIDSTGKAAGRVGLAALGGFAVGGPAGAAGAAAVTSPAALKVAINAGRALGTPAAQSLAGLGSKMAIQSATKLPDSKASDSPAQTTTPELSPLTQTPAKGEKKWMNDGAAKLIEHSPGDKDAIEKAKGAVADDKRIKDLLIKASDVKPGSPAMKKIMADLKARTASVD